MSSVVVINGHPDYASSISNKTILEELGKNPKVSIRNIIELYPDFKINVEEEQKALVDADLIILQFPYYWYSMPGILKHWMDLVFCYGFAYGKTGTHLQGKSLVLSFTAGSPDYIYTVEGRYRPMEELLTHFYELGKLTGLDVKTLYSYGHIYSTIGDKEKRDKVHAESIDHAKRLQHIVDKHI